MGVRVSFLGSKPAAGAVQAPKGVLVPPQAVTQRDGQSVVFVVIDGKAVQRGVKPAPQDVGTMKLLPDAVKVGGRVILSPPPSLRDGTDVNVKE